MPGRDITRLRNRATRILLFTFVIWAGLRMVTPVWSQSPAPTQSQTTPATPSANPPSSTPPAAAPAPATPQQTQPKKDEQDQQLNDQGVFVFKKDVDEVLLHASVVDDKQHIVTNLDRSAFSVFEDGKPQNIISF